MNGGTPIALLFSLYSTDYGRDERDTSLTFLCLTRLTSLVTSLASIYVFVISQCGFFKYLLVPHISLAGIAKKK